MSKKYDLLFRLLLIGDSGVGKTCVLCRFCEDEFHEHHISTIGIDFKLKTVVVDGLSVKVQIWDTAGQERYEAITKQYYQRAEGAFLVYDISNERSFKNIEKWLANIQQFSIGNIEMMLVGNKSDKKESRVISYEQGKQLAGELNIPFCETSARSDTNIGNAFVELTRVLVYKKSRRKKQQRICSEQDGSETSPIDSDSLELEMPPGELIDSQKLSAILKEDGKKDGGWCCSIL